jgi:hypothetical protein
MHCLVLGFTSLSIALVLGFTPSRVVLFLADLTSTVVLPWCYFVLLLITKFGFVMVLFNFSLSCESQHDIRAYVNLT